MDPAANSTTSQNANPAANLAANVTTIAAPDPIVPGAMGMRGWVAQLMQATAMVVIVLAFLWGQKAQFDNAAADREQCWRMHREVVEAVKELAAEVRSINRGK